MINILVTFSKDSKALQTKRGEIIKNLQNNILAWKIL